MRRLLDILSNSELDDQSKCAAILENLKQLTTEELGKMDEEVGRTILHEAAIKGWWPVINEWQQRGMSLKFQTNDEWGDTVLHLAASYGHLDIVKQLVQQDSTLINLPNQKGLYPIHRAAAAGKMGVISLLVEQKKSLLKLKTNDEWGDTVFHLAAKYGHLDIVKQLVQQDSTLINLPNQKGLYPIHIAAAAGKEEVISFLMKQKVSIPKLLTNDECAYTVLHVAAHFGHLNAVERLVQEDSTLIDSPNKKGWYPIHMAAAAGKVGVISLLVKQKKSLLNLKTNDKWGDTVLHLAVASRYEHLDVVKHLMSYPEVHSFIYKPNTEGYCPLHLAAKNGHQSIVSWLIEEQKAAIWWWANNVNPFTLAICNGHVEVVKYFLESESKIKEIFQKLNFPWVNLMEQTAGNGKLALHYLIDYICQDNSKLENANSLLELLLEHGANINQRTVRGENLLHLLVDVCHHKTHSQAMDNLRFAFAKVLIEKKISIERCNCNQWTPLDLMVRNLKLDSYYYWEQWVNYVATKIDIYCSNLRNDGFITDAFMKNSVGVTNLVLNYFPNYFYLLVDMIQGLKRNTTWYENLVQFFLENGIFIGYLFTNSQVKKIKGLNLSPSSCFLLLGATFRDKVLLGTDQRPVVLNIDNLSKLQQSAQDWLRICKILGALLIKAPERFTSNILKQIKGAFFHSVERLENSDEFKQLLPMITQILDNPHSSLEKADIEALKKMERTLFQRSHPENPVPTLRELSANVIIRLPINTTYPISKMISSMDQLAETTPRIRKKQGYINEKLRFFNNKRGHDAIISGNIQPGPKRHKK